MKLGLFLGAIGLAATLSAADSPLVVGRIVTGPQSRVQLTNTAKQPITAWNLVTTFQTGDGRTRQGIQTVDGYLSEATKGLPNSIPYFDRILPGETLEFPVDPLQDGATVRVTAVVLDDGTAVGDEAVIKSIFDRRLKERDAFRAVVETFNDVLPAQHGTAALDALRDRLNVLVERDPSTPCRAARDAVEGYRRNGAAMTADQIDQALRTYVDFVKREYDLAAKHSQRKTPSA